MITISLRHLMIAGAMLVAYASPSNAQLGALKKRLPKLPGAQQEPPKTAEDASTVRATVTVDYTRESTLSGPTKIAGMYDANTLPGPFLNPLPGPTKRYSGKSISDRTVLHSAATVAIDIGPPALPNGQLARMAAAANPVYMLIITQENTEGAGKLVSFNGEATYDRRSQEGETCHTARVLQEIGGGYVNAQINPATLASTASQRLTPNTVNLMVSFKEDRLVGVVYVNTKPLSAVDRVTYACPGSAPMETPATIHVSTGFSTEIPGTWKFTTTRNGNAMTVTGRMESVEGNSDQNQVRTVETLKITWDAPPAPQTVAAVQTGSGKDYLGGKGTISFTHDGKEATWKLNGTMNSGMMGMVTRVMTFTPDGDTPSEEKGVLTLVVMRMNGVTSLAGFQLVKGPAGDTEYNRESEKCALLVSELSDAKTQGSAQCAGGFSGRPISKFAFTAGR